MLYAVLREIGGEIPPGYSPERDSAADNYCGAIPLDFYNSFGIPPAIAALSITSVF